MRVIRNRSLKKMLILDNFVVSFAKNLDNGIHVPAFLGDKEDTVLLSLLPLLKTLSLADDVQAELKKQAGLAALYESYMKRLREA